MTNYTIHEGVAAGYIVKIIQEYSSCEEREVIVNFIKDLYSENLLNSFGVDGLNLLARIWEDDKAKKLENAGGPSLWK